MCGPSSAMKAINRQVQDFSKQVTDQAGQIFGDANKVFNDVVGSLTSIVKGGPSQAGFSAAELSARNAAAVQAGATEARNLKGAAASSVGAIGGGNVVAPAGSTQAITLGADQKAAADTAAAVNQVQQENYERGNQDYWKGVQADEQSTDVFNPSTSANKEASDALDKAETSQQSIDTANNWWANDIMQLGSAAIGGFTGGLGGSMFKGATKAVQPADPGGR